MTAVLAEQGTLYILGCSNREEAAQVADLMGRAHMMLIDIRQNPQSCVAPQWSRNSLVLRYGKRYMQAHGLGNNLSDRRSNDQRSSNHEEIQRRNRNDRAWKSVSFHLLDGISLILLCDHTCHRSLAAKQIQDTVEAMRHETACALVTYSRLRNLEVQA
jgi:hypothetical protein